MASSLDTQFNAIMATAKAMEADLAKPSTTRSGTREAWLVRAAAKLDALVAEAVSRNCQADATLAAYAPVPVHASVGFPSRRALSMRKRTIGQCWHASCSADGVSHVFVSPLLSDAIEVLGVLLHEIIHAVVGTEAGHKGPFTKLARAVGLEGKMTATVVGADLRARLESMAAELGPYPHPAFDPRADLKIKPQSTRQLKVHCDPEAGGCGYVIRVTAKWIEVGLPTCVCGCEMTEAI